MKKFDLDKSVASMLKSNAPIIVGLGLLLLSNGAMAQDMGDGLCGFYNKFMGKTLFGITLLSIVGGGLGILFGGEMTDYLKTLAKIVMVVGIMLGAAQLITVAFKAFGGMTC